MNKKLTPLEALRNLTQIAYGSSDDIDDKIKNYFEIIEKSLKDKELQDIIINEIKDLFAFGVLNTKVEPNDNGDINLIPNIVYRITREIDNKKKEIIRDFILKQCFPKELEALEILALVLGLNARNRIALKDALESGWITQEQYDLVDSALKHCKKNTIY